MTRELAVGIMIALAVMMLALMAWGWIRRTRRDSDVAIPFGSTIGGATFSAVGFYVATTRHDSPLDRIAARPLAFRSRADITVTDAGLGLSMPGETDVFVPAAHILGAGRATWTIDRTVERNGLVMVAWSDGSQILDTYLRLQDDEPATLVAAIDQIASAESPTGAHA
ncbi:MAG: PH-like domain-containing protein [Microbacterium gubbeenense]